MTPITEKGHGRLAAAVALGSGEQAVDQRTLPAFQALSSVS